MNAPDNPASRQHRIPIDAADVQDGWDEEFDPDIGDEPAIDLRAIWAAVYRNRWLIGAIIALCLLAGLAATMLAVPQYRADASIQIDQRAAKVLGTEDEDTYSSAADADRYLQTQVDVLKSRAMAAEVADGLNLYTNEAFLAAVGMTPAAETTQTDRRRAVIEALQANVGVNLPRNSRVVTISFASRSPNVSADIANAVTRTFIESSLQRRFDQSAYARSFLSEQLKQAKARLEQSELAAIAYARRARLIDTSDASSGTGQSSAPRSLTTADLVQLNQAYSQAQAQRLQSEERWEQARDVPLLSLPEVLGNAAIQDLTRKRAELEADYQQERQRHKEEYPTVRQARASLAAIDQQIGTIADSILTSLRSSYQVASKQERAFADRIEQLKSETLSEQDRSVRYNILKREADTNRQLYDGLLQRFREVSAASGATNNNIAVIDRAEPPARPFSPRPMLNLALAGLAGMALSAMFVFARERFDDAIREPGDMERKLGLSLLGVLPRVTGDPIAELDDPRSQISEANHALRTSLELSSAGGMPKSVLLTSSRQSEGKSTTSLSIARTLALAGKRILLIDADLRKPSLHRYLGVPNETGLSTLLAGQVDIRSVVQATTTPTLSIISSGPIPPDPAQLLASARLVELLDGVKADYDHIVIDGPPVLGLADAPRLAAIAEGVVFVVEAGRAHRGGAKAALRRLRAVHADVTGAVLTKFDPKHGAYGGYGYYDYGREGRTGLRGMFRS